MASWPPFVWLVLGGALLPVLPRAIRRVAMVVLPAMLLVHLAQLTVGDRTTMGFWLTDLVVLDVDALSLVFGWIFGITVLVWSIYAWHLERALEPTSAFLYAGGALGVVFAGDLLTLFLFWELMAIASTLVIVAAGTPRAYQAAYRYVVVHLAGGVLLLFGIGLLHAETGDLAVRHLGESLASPAHWLILLGVAVNAAVPPFGAWMPDAYPEGSPSGSVFLSAFTTKTSVYVLATMFAGVDLLIVVGALMSLYGIFYALNENDARRVLSYSIMNQVGFMVCGVGIGTGLAINGVAAHAFCHILYKSLLFMSAGAVLYRTGRTKCTELGGLWGTMPWTLVFGVVGALSISAMPLTNGFISKPMVVEAAAHGAHGDAGTGIFLFAYLALMVASAGVSLHAGIKFPWFVFFAKDQGLRPKEAPRHMLLAMGAVSFLCIALGVWPTPLYEMLPDQEALRSFSAYTPAHVVLQLEILIASGFAFFLLLPVLKRTDTITLDTDWFWRRGARAFRRFVEGPVMAFLAGIAAVFHERIPRALGIFSRNPPGAMRLVYDRALLGWAGFFGDGADVDRAQARLAADRARFERARPGAAWPIGTTVLCFALAFLLYLVFFLF